MRLIFGDIDRRGVEIYFVEYFYFVKDGFFEEWSCF